MIVWLAEGFWKMFESSLPNFRSARLELRQTLAGQLDIQRGNSVCTCPQTCQVLTESGTWICRQWLTGMSHMSSRSKISLSADGGMANNNE